MATIITTPINITANATYTDPVYFVDSGAFTISSGVTVLFDGGVVAARNQIFYGAGKVQFTGIQFEVYPEWWGAAVNSSTNDCQPAIRAAILSGCSRIRLQAADYWTNSTIVNDQSGVGIYLEGKWGQNGTGANGATRIVGNFNTGDIVYIGATSAPPSIDNYPRDQVWFGGEVTRAVPPLAPAPGSELSGAVGIRLKYTLGAQVTHSTSSEHSLAYLLDGNVLTAMSDNKAYRTVSGVGPYTSNDIFWGYVLNGNASIGLAGGNASTYLERNSSAVGGSPTVTQKLGLNCFGLFADTFIRDQESADLDGLQLTGAATAYGNLDVSIDHAVVDQFPNFGIKVDSLSASGSLTIVNCYAAPTAVSSALACLLLTGCGGLITAKNNEWDCGFNSAASYNCIGEFFYHSSGFDSCNRITDSDRPIVLDTCNNFRITSIVNNPNHDASQAAFYASSSARGYVQIMTSGASGAFPQGIYLSGSGVQYCEFNMTGVDPASTGGVANKLYCNGTSVTGSGLFNGDTDLASGFTS